MRFDPIALIERGYQAHPDSFAWLEATTQDLVQVVDPSYVAAMSYVLGRQGPEHPIVTLASGRTSLAEVQTIVSEGWIRNPADARTVMASCRKPGINNLRQVLGDASVDGWLQGLGERSLPMQDAVALSLTGPEGKPVVLTLACSHKRPVSEAEQAIWHRVAIHLSAGLRLVGRAPNPEGADVDAVLSPDGRIAHSSEASEAEHDVLRGATLDLDRARSRRERTDPLAALELWQGLLAGRWSLVEHFDSDGKRFLLAVRNEPGFSAPAALSLRQRQVVFYASLGLSTKEIAYALGLAPNTVSAHLSGGLSRLGIDSRAQLIRTSASVAQGALSSLASPGD